jgi:hypothetical protein
MFKGHAGRVLVGNWGIQVDWSREVVREPVTHVRPIRRLLVSRIACEKARLSIFDQCWGFLGPRRRNGRVALYPGGRRDASASEIP